VGLSVAGRWWWLRIKGLREVEDEHVVVAAEAEDSCAFGEFFFSDLAYAVRVAWEERVFISTNTIPDERGSCLHAQLTTAQA